MIQVPDESRGFFIIRINFKSAQTEHKIYLTNNNPASFAAWKINLSINRDEVGIVLAGYL